MNQDFLSIPAALEPGADSAAGCRALWAAVLLQLWKDASGPVREREAVRRYIEYSRRDLHAVCDLAGVGFDPDHFARLLLERIEAAPIRQRKGGRVSVVAGTPPPRVKRYLEGGYPLRGDSLRAASLQPDPHQGDSDPGLPAALQSEAIAGPTHHATDSGVRRPAAPAANRRDLF